MLVASGDTHGRSMPAKYAKNAKEMLGSSLFRVPFRVISLAGG